MISVAGPFHERCMCASDHRAFEHVQGGEERGGAVAVDVLPPCTRARGCQSPAAPLYHEGLNAPVAQMDRALPSEGTASSEWKSLPDRGTWRKSKQYCVAE